MFAFKSKHVRLLQDFIVWPKCFETETTKTERSHDRNGSDRTDQAETARAQPVRPKSQVPLQREYKASLMKRNWLWICRNAIEDHKADTPANVLCVHSAKTFWKYIRKDKKNARCPLQTS